MKKRLIRQVTVLFLVVSAAFFLTGCTQEWKEAAEKIIQAEKLQSTEVSSTTEVEEMQQGTESVFLQQEIDGNTEEPLISGKYAYRTLEEETRVVYDEIVDVILKQEKKIKVSTLDVDVLEDAYRAVCADYGGFFWVSGYVYTQYTRGGDIVEMEFSPKYTMTNEKRLEYQAKIDASVDELLSGISITDSDYAKAKYVFEILIQNVDYDASSENNQNIISVFLNRSTVCQGYACATQYLLSLLGIESTIVNGTANGESHAWNLVKLEGEYYYMDTTWGNSRYSENESQTEKYVNYNYLAVTSEEISRTHILDTSFSLPECTAMEYNYFVQEGKYFEVWDADKIGNILKEAWEGNRQAVAVKFSSIDLYEQAILYFIEEQHIADYCDNISTVHYLEDAEQFVLTLNFSNK